MTRKGATARREIVADPVYQNVLVTQLINKVLLSGKKSIAERTVYKALEVISERTANNPVITLKKAVENVRPSVEVRSRRVGGSNYQVPVEVRPRRATLGSSPAAASGSRGQLRCPPVGGARHQDCAVCRQLGRRTPVR